MVRQKGTLINFQGDGAITPASVKWLLRTGKVAVGKERVQLIERKQLLRWGVLIEPEPEPQETKKTKSKSKTVSWTEPQPQEVGEI
ncbi:MAG: hypothetical protein WC261_08500 [Synergistaceae bacterium]|jgi:hypothetical protein